VSAGTERAPGQTQYLRRTSDHSRVAEEEGEPLPAADLAAVRQAEARIHPLAVQDAVESRPGRAERVGGAQPVARHRPKLFRCDARQLLADGRRLRPSCRRAPDLAGAPGFSRAGRDRDQEIGPPRPCLLVSIAPRGERAGRTEHTDQGRPTDPNNASAIAPVLCHLPTSSGKRWAEAQVDRRDRSLDP
jgi:hypothetical protein